MLLRAQPLDVRVRSCHVFIRWQNCLIEVESSFQIGDRQNQSTLSGCLTHFVPLWCFALHSVSLTLRLKAGWTKRFLFGSDLFYTCWFSSWGHTNLCLHMWNCNIMYFIDTRKLHTADLKDMSGLKTKPSSSALTLFCQWVHVVWRWKETHSTHGFIEETFIQWRRNVKSQAAGAWRTGLGFGWVSTHPSC